MADVLVINCGSSSLKFAIVEVATGRERLSGLAERLFEDAALLRWEDPSGSGQERSLPPGAGHREAMQALVDHIQSNGLAASLMAVGHRAVHGGEAFSGAVLIDDAVLDGIRSVSHLAPLHNPANILGMEAALQAFPELPQAAVFDTAFHQSLPPHAYLYPLPYALYVEQGVRRYGFHGTSHQFVSEQAAVMLDKPLEDCALITAHLGNGASITAVRGGRSVDTSMGLTPLEGLVMGTRCGDIDPSLPAFLAQELDLDAQAIDKLLNKDSGLLGISGLSNDCRKLEQAAADGHERAQLALEVFCYRLAKYVASYQVPVGGADALVFTGGIGENSAFVRERVVCWLAPLGFSLDDEANLAARFGTGGRISADTGPAVLVIPTNEEWVIARSAAQLAAPASRETEE